MVDEARPYELKGNRWELKPRWEAQRQRWLGIRTFERLKSR
jgi:hypothetical protein